MRVTAKAFATSANLGPGFDVCGLCLSRPFDLVSVEEGTAFSIANNGAFNAFESKDSSPLAKIACKLAEDKGISKNLAITVTKNIKPKAGMGSSAAESVGLVLALNELFSLGLSKKDVVGYASFGEEAAAGSRHFDNVSPCAFGGFTVTTQNPLHVTRITPPEDLEVLLLISSAEKPSTAFARSILPQQIPLKQSVQATCNAIKLVNALSSRNTEDIIEAVQLDEVIEPARAKANILPLLFELREEAKSLGVGVCASGAGPTLLALTRKGNEKLEDFKKKALELFSSKGLTLDVIETKPELEGSKVVRVE